MENGIAKTKISCAVSVLFSHLSLVFFFKAENEKKIKEARKALNTVIEPLKKEYKINYEGEDVKNVTAENREDGKRLLSLIRDLCIKHNFSFTPYGWEGFDEIGGDPVYPDIFLNDYIVE